MYAEGAGYQTEFNIADAADDYLLSLPSWYGSVARVLVNGQSAGHFVSRPWEVDISSHLQKGRNTIEVQVIGTLKNTLGPHHGEPVLGKAWPWAFRQAPAQGPPPGDDYFTVEYGLFAPPVLVQMSESVP